jgi:multidrug efflux pump subunit AcrA (membrane-fusion protein)
MKCKILSWSMTVLCTLALWIAAGAGLLLTGCGRGQTPVANAEAAKTLYTCGMHPQVIQDKPGNCPICGMKLTPIRKQAGSLGTTNVPASNTGERKIKYYKSTMNPGEVKPEPGKDSMGMEMVPVYADEAAAAQSQAIALDSVTIQNMGIRTAAVTRGPLRRGIRTVGTIDYNETAQAEVSTKFKGWIEKLYVDATGQQVHRGDPLFEIYSPELYSAQREYLLAREQGTNVPGGVALKTSALTKLKFFDISDAQIADLDRTGQPSKTLRILAPMDGFVVEKMVVQGQMVEPGMKIYRLADLGLVWVQAQIYEQDLPYVKLGQEATVTLSYLSDREFRGRVTYIYPNVDEKTRTARVRMEFHNPGYFLKPGMFATVQVSSELNPSVLLVPDMAILRSGEKYTAFVALDGGKFEPRTLTLGPQAENDMYQVISGLKEGERIVTSGQFMLDSESQLREAIQKMLQPNQPVGNESVAQVSHETVTSTPNVTNASPSELSLKYTCPMASHADVVSDKPGKCPKCEMDLVPTSTVSHGKVAEETWRKQHSSTPPIADTMPQQHQH